MRDNCLDIGKIQAFLDGELTQNESVSVSDHIAECDVCSFMLAEAEEEAAIVFPALAREMDTLVPTQRLWAKINDSLETERHRQPFWHRIQAFLALLVSSPGIAAAAGVIIVAGVFAVVWLERPDAVTETAHVTRPDTARVTPVVPNAEPKTQAPSISQAEAVQPKLQQRNEIRVERASYRVEPRSEPIRPVNAGFKHSPTPAAADPLAAEDSYVKTIATLAKTVDTQKDSILGASERVAYERDMALVNDTIDKMRSEVKRNPKNESAKQVLYSSYQNKIDLLNSVAQKEELVASLR